ncbi:MAG: lipoate--protein ligase family protein [Calditrichaeota bacterium]|nr:lipoate--protein ligase family protein [Calditrichota bacterium]
MDRKKPLRLIDAGTIPYLESQTIYHAVAHAMTPETPDTAILVSPQTPYVCVGFHQEVDREVDLEYCQAHQIPVTRREVGGGAVLLDANQIFTQWVFQPDHVPLKVVDRFRLHAEPIMATYRDFGVEANFRPINDIHVSGKKIGGMGAAAIGNAEVVVSSLMLDFDTRTMARVLKVPNEKFRDKVFQGLENYMTTLKKELGQMPDRDEVKQHYVRHLEEVLQRPVEWGELTPGEKEVMAQLNARFATREWLYQKGGLVRGAVKIHSGVWVGETAYKAPGGLIRITLRIRENTIDDLAISGDFTFYPQHQLAAFEAFLKGHSLEPATLRRTIEAFYQETGVQTPGIEVDHWLTVFGQLADAVAKHS